MTLVDTHTHIYLPEFDEDRPEILKKANEAGVEFCLLPAIDSSTHEAMLYFERNNSSCKAMIGLHPCSVNQDFEKELAIINQYITQRKFVAIGEIGLDFYWDKTFLQEQYLAFERQIEFALKLDLPVSIHSRNATDECIEIVEKFPGLKGVFHCFSGNVLQAERIIQTGMYLGIGGVVTFKNGGLDKVLPQIGIGNLILETDAPYLAPVPFRGKRNEPSYVKIIAEKIAEVLNLPLSEVAELTSKNAKNLFAL